MSDKMRMQAIDKAEVKAAVKVITKTKLERIANTSGLKLGTIIASIIEEHASTIETTPEDIIRANEIMEENISKRNARKAIKGVK